ncbi:MAG: prepilin-type N-terminal cleavage/methylation domain-containing protein [Candidatus Paceibacterota bacterium]|jgi:prepilin-type N-terminal cleavage/methylation domain-containing protein
MISYKLQVKKGFTLIETMIVLAIIAILAGIIISSLSSFRNGQVLKNTAGEVLSILAKARSQTLSSNNSSQYGVHVLSDSITFFTGASYVFGAAGNQVTTLDPLATISSVTLAGGGSDIIFDRLTGATSQSGTLVISLVSDSAKNITITIPATGIISSN